MRATRQDGAGPAGAPSPPPALSSAAAAPAAHRFERRVRQLPKIDTGFSRELASLDVVRGKLLYGFLAEERHPSKILQQRSLPGQRLGELYDHMLASDADLAAFFRKRHDAVLSLPRRIVPADGSSAAREIADFCRWAIAQVPNFATNLAHQLEACEKGLAIDELLWERVPRGVYAGAWVPVDLIDRPMWRFAFREGQLHVRQALGGQLIAAPSGKFLVARYGTKDSCWGHALLDELYWIWWVKKQVLKFYATHLDRWADPALVGRYKHRLGGADAEATNEQDQATLLEAIETLRESAGIAIPQGLVLETLEAKRSGAATYEQLIALLTRAQATLVLGEVDTSGAAKGPGSFAKSEVSNQVRLEKVALDAHDLSAHLKDDLLRLLVGVNFGPDAPVPEWTIDTVEAEDRKLRGEGIQALLGMKQAVPRRYAYQTYQVPEPAPGEPVVEAAAAPPPPAEPGPEPGAPNDGEEPAAPPRDETTPAEGAEAAAARSHHHLAVAVEDELEAEARERIRDVDAVAAEMSGRTVAYYQGWVTALRQAWGTGAVAAGSGLRYLLDRIDPLEHARAVATANVHGIGLSLLHLRRELGDSALGLDMPPAWSAVGTPTEAMEYWAQLLNLPKSAFLALDDSQRRLAFTVAGVTDLTVLSGIYQLIGRAVAEGWVEREWVRELDALMERLGVSPLADWHARLIYSNNVRSLWGLVRYQNTIGNPRGWKLTPYLTWLTLDDGKVRARHLLMHKKTFGISHPIWKTWWTPAGNGCRCDVATINAIRAKKLGLRGEEPTGPWPLDSSGQTVLPDPGFRGAPNLDPLAAENERRAEDLVSQNQQTPDIEEAMKDLFAQYFGANLSSLALAAS